MGSQNGHADTKMALVSSFDPARYAVKVTLQPEGNLTGWLPLGALWVGAGWGLYAPPSIGDMVEVQFEDGHPEAGIAGLKFFNDTDQPLSVNAGEFWLVHKSGAFFKLLNSGALSFADGQGATLTMNGDGSMTTAANAWTHNGPLTVTGATDLQGDVTLGGSMNSSSGDFVIDGVNVKTHGHSGVATGPGTSGPPA